MDLSLVFHQGDAILIAVFLLLLAMSVSSWWLILMRSVRYITIRRANRALDQAFWATPDWVRASEMVHNAEAPIARIAQAGLDALAHYRQHATRTLGQACGIDDYLTRVIRQTLSRESAKLENGMTWLATVGAVAPFVGLFGTVWGIYNALIGIAHEGQASIGAVSGPIGEALVATAAGLAVAIPAVVAYNALLRANRVLSADMDGFAHDLHAQLLTQTGETDGVR